MQNMKVDPVLAARSELGLASRAKDEDRILAARRQLAAARIEREINAACNGNYPITDDQRRNLAALLAGGGLDG